VTVCVNVVARLSCALAIVVVPAFIPFSGAAATDDEAAFLSRFADYMVAAGKIHGYTVRSNEHVLALAIESNSSTYAQSVATTMCKALNSDEKEAYQETWALLVVPNGGKDWWRGASCGINERD
jgi:hypothetical protein